MRRGPPCLAQHPGGRQQAACNFQVFAVLAWLGPLLQVLPGGTVSVGGPTKFRPAPESLLHLCRLALAERLRYGLELRLETHLAV